MKPINFILACCIVFAIGGCSNGNQTEDNKMENVLQPILEADLGEAELDVWQEFLWEWQRTEFVAILDAKGFEQDCEDCDSMWWTVEFKVTDEGRIVEAKVLERDVDCPNRSELEKDGVEEKVLESLERVVMPGEFFGKMYTLRWGRPTRC